MTAKAAVRRLLPRAVKPRRILGGPLRGRRIVTSWHDYPGALRGTTERALLQWFSDNVKQGETWLDVGAHYGYTTLAIAALVGPRGRVFAFEPMLRTVGHLSLTRTLNRLENVSVVPIGLSNDRTLTALRIRVERGMASVGDGNESDTIYLLSLDTIWEELAGSLVQVDGIKIDVQGMELGALKGMQGILRSCTPKVAVELHAGVNRDAILALLSECGYRLPGIPVDPLPGESVSAYADDRSYVFLPA